MSNISKAYKYASYTNKQDDTYMLEAIKLLTITANQKMLWEVLMEACNVLEKTPAELANAIEAGMTEWDI